MVGAADDDLEAGDVLASCQSLLSERRLEHGAPPRSDRSNSGSSKRAGRKHATFAASSSSATTSSSTAVVQKISTAAVVVHLIKGNIGPGAMSLPSGFSKVGIVAGPIMFVLVALVSVYNMDLLLRCKRLVSPHRPMSFGEVGRAILGPRGKTLIDVFLVGTQLGICCVYFTFVATNIHTVLPADLQDAINERQLILGIFPILLLLSWIQSLHHITPYSSLANCAVLLGIMIVFYFSIDYWRYPTQFRFDPDLFSWSELPEFYGTAVYSFEGIGLILPIQNEMQRPELFPRVLAICMLAILVLFLILGEVPAISFGRITNGSMTAVLHDFFDGWLVAAANLLLAFACLLSFPIQFYPAIDVLERALARHSVLLRPRSVGRLRENSTDKTGHHHRRKHQHHHHHRDKANSASTSGHDDEQSTAELLGAAQTSTKRSRHESDTDCSSVHDQNLQTPSRRPPPPEPSVAHRAESILCNMSQYDCNRIIFRSMLCTSLMIIAVCIPDVGLLISLFGSIGSSMLAIILPPVLYIQAKRGAMSMWSLIFHYSIVIVGVAGMITGTVQTLLQVAASFGYYI